MSLHRAIIVSTSVTTKAWKTREAKRLAFENTLNSMKNADFTLDWIHRDFTPEVVNGRITRESFDKLSLPLLKEGYDFVLLHMSSRQWKAWKLEPHTRGIAQTVDGDEVAEGYFWADENTKRNGYNQFIETGLHELSHLFCYGAKRLDETHAYHDANGTIVGLFTKYDMDDYQRDRFLLKKKVSFLQCVLAKLQATTKTYPLASSYWSKPSQAYGVANSAWYPLTGHHIGTDFATPVGTPIKAHQDGVVIDSGYLPKSLGYWCQVQYQDYCLVFCHLKAEPKRKTVLRGEVIAYTGNTGFTTGAHLHLEGWHKPMDRSKLNKETWKTLTFDVMTRI